MTYLKKYHEVSRKINQLVMSSSNTYWKFSNRNAVLSIIAVAVLSIAVASLWPVLLPLTTNTVGVVATEEAKSSPTTSSPTTNFFKNLKEEAERKGEDTCFCQLHGGIDDCSCQIGDVDKFNNFKIFPRLKSVLSKPYFRYFQINLKKPCPFWSDDGTCGLESCQVKTCKDDEIPIGLKGQKRKMSVKRYQKDGCSEDDLGSINETISEESQADFEKWKSHDESLVDFCTVKDDTDPNEQYVDLLLNPERFTGYAGPSAHRVWSSIYNENCFKQSFTTSFLESFGYNNSNETCIEKRAFYRAISGLHASINIHLSAKYLLSGSKVDSVLGNTVAAKWGPNVTEFRNKFDKPEAHKEGFSWLKNLYFLYLLELKAVMKAAPFLRNFNFYTGNNEEDSDMKMAIADFLRTIEAFPSHFDESALFSNKDGPKLKAEFHGRFTNITRIMDCVGCQKCKLWGTIQVKGLGTALKILFSDASVFKRGSEFLSRTEIVSLINAFGRVSNSIFELENFRRLMDIENHEGNSASSPLPFGFG